MLTTGGAFYSAMDSNDLELRHVDFINNTAGLYGGSVYIGDNHASILFSHVSVSGSSAESGGGLFFNQFSTGVLISSCSIMQNSATVGGGLRSLASELTVVASFFDDNVAITSCGGVCVEEAAAFSLLQSSISGNVAGSTSGGLGVSSSVNVTIEFCDFVKNRVLTGSGGAMYVLESQVVLVNNISFFQNSATVMGGGVFVDSVSSYMSFLDTRWQDNVASVGGGALYATGSVHLEVNGSTFSENIVQAGSGSAICVRESLAVLSWNLFDGNEAVGGGGTVFWEHASGMDEPLGLQAGGNVFDESNAAGYGPRWATEAHHLRLLGDQEVYIIVGYLEFAPLVGVTLEDVYGQAVVTDSTTTATVSVPPSETSTCDKEPGFVSGSTTVSFVNGTAIFSALEPLCAPNHSLALAIAALSDSVANETAIEFYFRACSRGEYYGERICNACENGSYSFADPGDFVLSEMTKEAVCQPCPSQASHCYKDTMVLRQGYWRSDDDSTNIVECPWGAESCLGGENNSDASCASGYRGPLCAICEDEHHFVSSSQTCEQCDDTSSFFDPFTVMMIALAGICVLAAVYAGKNIVRQEAVTSVDAFIAILLLRMRVYHEDTYVEEKAMKFHNTYVMKQRVQKTCVVYFTFYQIVSTMPFILADVDFPDVYDRLMSAVSVVNLSVNQEAIASCSSGAQYDYVTKLVIDTTYPMAIALLLWLCSRAHIRYVFGADDETLSSQRRRIAAKYEEAMLMLSVLILPSGTCLYV
jgi:hypothetical protein